MAQEQLVLDGLALNNPGSYILQGFDVPPPKKRHEWAQGGDGDGSALVRDPLFENREITLRIRVSPRATMDLALAAISAISDKLEEAEKQPNGLDLVWTPANSTKSVTFKVLSGEITELPVTLDGDDAGWFLRSPAPVVTVVLTCKPFGYGAEVLSSSASSATPFVTLTLASVAGDVPAEGRLIITDAATQNRRHLEWGLEQQYYNAATSLLVDSDNMVTTGTVGVQTTRTGAYDPNASGNNVVRGTLYGTTSAVVLTGNLGHVGTFLVKARVQANGSGPVVARLAWQDGDGEFRANRWVQVATMATWFEVDLGVISISPKVSGTQKWSGRIEAYSDTVGDTIDVDYLILVPAGEGYGKARTVSPVSTSVNLSAYDNFNSLGAGTGLNTRAASVGGTWATSGVATDFVGGGTGFTGTASRGTALLEAGPRFAVLGATNYTDIFGRVYVFYSSSVFVNGHVSWLILRWVDSSNHLRVQWAPGGNFQIQTVIAGVVNVVATTRGVFLPNTVYGIQAFAWATGTVKATLLGPGNIEQFSITGTSSALATGGTLQTGKPGFADQALGSGAPNRLYDFFSAGSPSAENPVIASTRSAEIRSDRTIRADSTNTYWGVVPSYRGSRFFVPPAGDENRTSRILAKANRLDVDVDAATNVTDNLTVQAAVTPRYLAIPR